MLCKANPPSSSENINSTARVFIFPFLMAMFSLMLKTIHTLCFISLCLSKKAPSLVCFLENFISFFVCYKSKILFTINIKLISVINSVKIRIVLDLEHDHFDKNKPETTKIKKVNRAEGLFGEHMLSFKVFYSNGCNFVYS